MVQADPFDMWHVTEKPELTVKYEHGPNIPYYSYNQIRRAFEAGRKSAPAATITTATACQHNEIVGTLSFGPDGHKSEMACKACGKKL